MHYGKLHPTTGVAGKGKQDFLGTDACLHANHGLACLGVVPSETQASLPGCRQAQTLPLRLANCIAHLPNK
jgi:hypothetical protein